MDILELLVIVLASVGLLIFVVDWMWKPKLDLPYPKRLPVIGNLVTFMKNPPGALTSWAESCGDIYCVQLMHKTVVIVSDHDAAYEVLVKNGKKFGGRTHTFRNYMISGNGSDIVFQSINPRWKMLRMFTHQNIKQYGGGLGQIEEIVQQNAYQLIESIHKESVHGVIDPYEIIYLAVVNSMIALITGKSLTSDDPLFRKLVKINMLVRENITIAHGAELDVMPWLRHLGNKTFKGLSELVKRQEDVHQIFKTMYNKGTLSREGLACSLLNEMHHKESDLSRILSDKIIQVVIFDLLVAGVMSSGAILYIFSMVMAANPQIQQSLFEEIVRCKGAESEIPMSLSDRANMPYTRALLLELLRYASVFPMSNDHTAMEDTDILGHKIPKGTEVYVNLLGLHHSEKYWDEPRRFRPERFLDENGQLVASDHINRKRMMPFGAGPRVCIGQSFAMSRLFILATSLVRAFHIRPVMGEKIEEDPRKFTMGAVLNAPRCKLFFMKR